MLQRVTSRKECLREFEFMLAGEWQTNPPRQSLPKNRAMNMLGDTFVRFTEGGV